MQISHIFFTLPLTKVSFTKKIFQFSNRLNNNFQSHFYPLRPKNRFVLERFGPLRSKKVSTGRRAHGHTLRHASFATFLSPHQALAQFFYGWRCAARSLIFHARPSLVPSAASATSATIRFQPGLVRTLSGQRGELARTGIARSHEQPHKYCSDASRGRVFWLVAANTRAHSPFHPPLQQPPTTRPFFSRLKNNTAASNHTYIHAFRCDEIKASARLLSRPLPPPPFNVQLANSLIRWGGSRPVSKQGTRAPSLSSVMKLFARSWANFERCWKGVEGNSLSISVISYRRLRDDGKKWSYFMYME